MVSRAFRGDDDLIRSSLGCREHRGLTGRIWMVNSRAREAFHSAILRPHLTAFLMPLHQLKYSTVPIHDPHVVYETYTHHRPLVVLGLLSRSTRQISL